MTIEKVISYLNINEKPNDNKSLPKICFGFNLGVTLFISIFAILLFQPSNYCIYIFWGLFDVIYFILCLTYKKTWWQIPMTSIGLFVLTLKTFFAYKITSQFEFSKSGIPMFTWLHSLVLVLSIGTIAYFGVKSYQAYKILKNNTLTSAKKEIASRNRMPKWIALIASLSGSPMILVRLLRDDFKSFGLGMGFAMWSLGLVFVILFAMLLPKLVVFLRYRVWSVYK